MSQHSMGRQTALSLMNETKAVKKMKKIETQVTKVQDYYDAVLLEYQNYLTKTKGYRQHSNYETESHFKNLKRIGEAFRKSDNDPSDLLSINDPENEVGIELAISEYIQGLICTNKTADTAIVYLNDLKRLIKYKYTGMAEIIGTSYFSQTYKMLILIEYWTNLAEIFLICRVSDVL